MVTFEEIVDACHGEGISVSDIDRILVKSNSYEKFKDNSIKRGIKISDHATISGPAVRETTGSERFIYVDNHGYEQEVEL